MTLCGNLPCGTWLLSPQMGGAVRYTIAPKNYTRFALVLPGLASPPWKFM